MNYIYSIESSLTSQQEELEEFFRQNNIPVHHNWVFSKENRGTINELTMIIKECTKDLKEVPYYKIWQYCICFISMQKIARQVIWKVNLLENTPRLTLATRDLKYYCRYSVAIYGSLLTRILIENKYLDLFASESEETIFCRYLGMQEDQLLYSQMMSRKFVPCHAVSIDASRKAIVLSIRGTMSLFDCMTDLQGVYIDYTHIDPVSQEALVTGRVHSGIMRSAMNISEEILPFLSSCMREWPDYSIILTGHSLGAGTASLLCLLWLSLPEFAAKDLRAYVYGPPAVLSENLNEYLKEVVHSCVHGNDLICRLSLGSVKDLAEMIKYSHTREQNDPGFNASSIANNWFHGNDVDNMKMIEVYRDITKNFKSEKLVPPGNILQLYRPEKHSDYLLISQKSEEGVVGKYVCNNFYRELVIDKASFLDHMPNAYEEAIGGLLYRS